MSRPEHIAPPELFYNDAEASKYTSNSRIQIIQAAMTERCIELLNLPSYASDSSVSLPSLILDIGCGSGLSGEILTEAGHQWVGVDIAPSMLEVALERESEGDLFLHDIGQGFGFRPGSMDGAISVSVLQWLCNADRTVNAPPARLARFFNTLFASLKRGARAIFQFYPESDDQVNLIMSIATKAGFTGGLVVDYPNSRKAKKFYLCLMSGLNASSSASNEIGNRLPKALGTEDDGVIVDSVAYEHSREKKHRQKNPKGKKGSLPGDKDWILRKKSLYRQRGKEDVPNDSKFTGRKRRAKF
ncbi:MAG: hypothetical protein CYPHOPRED_000567 [Cyphobasidiales sp. Tagirdzhanova-0007]|nr:MAG: hypothetical protein CYPHOPRED_000567 [Cyphobasidiales sp. Tagirdzhanova-0007]